MKNEVPTPERDDLIKLRQDGLTRDEIASYYGVTLARVKRWIADYEIPTPSTPKKQKEETEEGTPLPPDHGMTLIERAQRVLGKRMGEDYRGYLLDGRPVRVDVLVRAAGLKIEKVQ